MTLPHWRQYSRDVVQHTLARSLVLFTCDAEITESEVVHNEENNVFDCRCHGHGWPRSAKEQPSETQSHDPAHLEIVSVELIKGIV